MASRDCVCLCGCTSAQMDDPLGSLKPGVLVLQFDSLKQDQTKLVYGAYQQLLQAHDYIGHAHYTPSRPPPGDAGANSTCASCDTDIKDPLVPHVWLGLVRRAQLLHNLFNSRRRSLAAGR